MTRKLIPLVALTVLFAFCTLSRPTGTAAQTKQLDPQIPKVNITSVTLPGTGCGIETICVEVKWDLVTRITNANALSFEVSGKLHYQQGTSCNTNVVTVNSSARSAKVGVFQGGSCNGTVTRADVTVKVFSFDIEGQKVLKSTANKTQTF